MQGGELGSVILACVQWKEAGDRKREDILLGKWFQVTQACCPQPQTPETPASIQAPSRLLSQPGGALIIFLVVLLTSLKYRCHRLPVSHTCEHLENTGGIKLILHFKKAKKKITSLFPPF